MGRSGNCTYINFINTHTYRPSGMSLCLCVCIYIYMYLCICACPYVFICICACIYLCLYIRRHFFICILLHKYMCVYICFCTFLFIYLQVDEVQTNQDTSLKFLRVFLVSGHRRSHLFDRHPERKGSIRQLASTYRKPWNTWSLSGSSFFVFV